jgi:alpha-L-fucosidase
MNQMVRELQPGIIINNRSLLDEDFGTPEEHISAIDRDWEACMTFNGLSWGYIDSAQAKPYSYSAQQIARMLHTVSSGGGNLLLNIGPTPEGGVPEEAVEPLTQVGCWLAENGEAVYGSKTRSRSFGGIGIGGISVSGNTAYLWCRIWPSGGSFSVGGFMTKLTSVSFLKDGTDVDFSQEGQRIILKGLPETSPDSVLGVTVLKLEFQDPPKFVRCSAYPQLHQGHDLSSTF